MSTATSPTVQYVSKRVLSHVGITQIAAQAADSELESLTDTVKADCATALTAAIQDVFEYAPGDTYEQPQSAVLRAPATYTLTATNKSTTIVFAGYQSYMRGCTVRLAGDTQDNEIVSSTKLARPFMGPTGSVSATVYSDSIPLDDTINQVIHPVEIPNQLPLHPCQSRIEYLKFAGAPSVADVDGIANNPFFYFYNKVVQRPRAWWIESYYDATLSYQPKRIRLAPMPDTEYPLGFRATINPPHYTADDIGSEVATVSGTLSPASGGAYRLGGTFNDDSFYVNDSAPSTPYFIFVDPADDAWTLAPLAMGVDAINYVGEGGWKLVGTGPTGSYAHVSPATGTATVTIGSGDDPGTTLPIPNTWVETIYLPLALRHFSMTASFKNESLRPSIEANARMAIQRLQSRRGQVSYTEGRYI